MGEKWCIRKSRGYLREIGGYLPQNRDRLSRKSSPPEVHTPEADTEKPNTSKPQEQSERVSEEPMIRSLIIYIV